MVKFDMHTEQTAPEKSRALLAKAKEKYGFLPNVLAVMAESPAALKGYLTLNGILGESSFSPAEQQILMLTTARENGCEYCVAAHSMGASRAGANQAVVDAIRNNRALPDAHLQALAQFCRLVVDKRGWVGEGEIKAFLDAGFSKAQVFEVVLAVAVKTISNYVNHMAETPLDKAFEKAKWEKKAAAA